MFDIVMISYDELNANKNWKLLKEQVPYAIRIDGIMGIANAHIEAAKQVSTSHFFCVDADNIVNDNFEFDIEKYVIFQRNDNHVHVWGCRNPVNGLTYGYGGVKFFPTDHVRDIENYSIDFCTSVAASLGGFKFHKDVISTTHFNTSPYNAWKSGYRECTKLALQDDDESKDRLKIWVTTGMNVEYGNYTIAGARMGVMHSNDKINDINDFFWCKEKFDNEVKDRDILELIEEYDVSI